MTPDPIERLRTALADRYRIERELGAGGMATVYLAHDLKHDRDVAIKVLHPDLAAALGAERFLAEIRTTANLQHPHILPLHDSGAVDGFLYYVMPFIEGETLRARLTRERQLPVDDALRIAREVADALAYAHAQGVIHRDIKPENILLQGGHALVADFGIALAVQTAGGQRMTQTGLSLGTPQYMSPEQAMGERTIDARSDLYALGAVTYEMLTGDAPFTGSSVQAIVARVLTEKPAPIRTVRDTVPVTVERAVLRALSKVPADRQGNVREFSEALDGRGVTEDSGAIAAGAQAGGTRAGRAWRTSTVALAAVAMIAVGLALRERTAASMAAARVPVIRAHFDLPSGAHVADALSGPTLAVSRDGSVIAFTSLAVNGFRLYFRRVDELEAREVSDANISGRNLTFSPDGKWLAFTEGNVLRKISVDGGQTTTLGETGGAVPYGLAWSESGMIYMGSFSGLFSVSESGGQPTRVAGVNATGPNMGRRWPLLLPGGKAVAYARGNGSTDAGALSVLELATGEITDHDLPLAAPLGLIDDRLVYVSPLGAVMAVRVNESTARPLGEPVLIEDGVLVDPTAGAKASLSRSGTLLFMQGRAEFQPVLVSSAGAATAVMDDPRNYSTPRYSPDGRRVALTVIGTGSTDVWIYDLDRNTFSRLTTAVAGVRPEWTADGKYVVFISEKDGRGSIFRQLADGSGAAELFYAPELEPYEAIVSPDMKTLVYRTAPGLTFPRDILAVPYEVAPGATRTVTPLVTAPTTESMPRISPNGSWLAYQSNIEGRFEVYVRPFPGDGGTVKVSNAGGTEPLWGRDGRSLYYRGSNGEVWQVEVQTGASFKIGARKTLFTGDYRTDTTHPSWDVAPDGRFLMLKRAGAATQMVVVHQWARVLRSRLAGGR